MSELLAAVPQDSGEEELELVRVAYESAD